MPLAFTVGALLVLPAVLFALSLAQTFGVVGLSVTAVLTYVVVLLGQDLRDNSLAHQFPVVNVGKHGFQSVLGWW